MEASPEPPRRRRYAPSLSASMPVLTPVKLHALRLLAECRLLSLPQIALLMEGGELRPKSAREKSARRHLRELFDAGLVAVLPVPRSALAGRDSPNDASLLFGSAPNVYAPTTAGVRLIADAGLVSSEVAERYGISRKAKGKNTTPNAPYGPKNSLFLAHELLVRDVRVWAERLNYPISDSGPAASVERWEDGEAATLLLPSGLDARPDAWLVLRTGMSRLVGLCEADRGTERGRTRWREKVERYAELFVDAAERGNDSVLASATGYHFARVLVFAPDVRRRDALADTIRKECENLGMEELAGRFWIAATDDLVSANTGNGFEESKRSVVVAGLHAAVWRVAGTKINAPLLSSAEPGTAEKE